ncbi:MAG: hypothetical protein OXP70_04150 [Acidobacteriota bacterium]|nr:hypothetical protein [Acidobacteriota bacterium]
MRSLPRRLVHALPEVFLGADAVAGLDGSRGFLVGEKRHRQVDVLGFEPAPEAGRGPAALEALVERRLDRSGIQGWRIVGVAVESADLERGGKTLLEGLVAGDVVIAAACAAAPGRRPDLRILVHRGDCLAELRNRSRSERRPPAGIDPVERFGGGAPVRKG